MGFIAAQLSWVGWLVVIFCVSMALDYLTGTAVAIKEKRWSSAAANIGLWKKLGAIIAIFVAGLTDGLLCIITNNLPEFILPFEYSFFISPLVIIWYILTETGSIIENIAKLGAPVPPFLKDCFAALNKSAEQTISKKKK